MIREADLPFPDAADFPVPRPLVPLAVAFCLGIGLEWALQVAPSAWVAALLLACLAAAAAWWRGARRLLPSLLAVGFCCLGGQAMAAALFGDPANSLGRLPEAYLDSPLALEGWVVGPPDPRPAEARDTGDPGRTRFVAEVTRLRLGETWASTTGRARLTVLGEVPAVAYGDEIRGSFRLRRPRRFDNPGSFDYPGYLATQGIALEGWTREPMEALGAARGSPALAALFRLRSLLLQRLDAALPPSEAALLKATVLGDRSGLTPEMNQAFLDSGTYHILAISGLNVSLLAGALFGLFRLLRASPRLAAAGSMLLVTLYAALAGASPSVIRAAVMADTYLLAVVLDRQGDLLNSLALSALVLLWWNPRFLFDVGFQLTYLATLGIILVLPQSNRRLRGLPWPLRYPLESVVITLAATAMTLPILASAFNRLAPVGVLANLPIVPLSGLITGLGTAASASLLLVPTGVSWLNQINGWLVDLLFALAQWFASWPWSSLRVYTPTPGMLVAYYALVVAGLLRAASPGQEPRTTRRVWARWMFVAPSLALGILLILRLHPPEGPPTVRVTLLDVGQGESIFVEFPDGQRMLVDAGGPAGEAFDIGSRVVAPFLWHEWIGRLEVLVLTHAEADHVSGVPAILRSFPVGEVWAGDVPSSSVTSVWIQEYLRHRRIPYRIVSAGSPPLRMGGAAVEVLYPGSRGTGSPGGRGGRPLPPNATSLVMRLGMGDHTILLTEDVGREGEAALRRDGKGVRAQVLKVPHHGSRTSSASAFLAAVRPEVAVVSVGYRNRFRHPHPEVLERYRTMGIRLLRTDLNGAITVEITSEGIRAWGRREETAGGP